MLSNLPTKKNSQEAASSDDAGPLKSFGGCFTLGSRLVCVEVWCDTEESRKSLAVE